MSRFAPRALVAVLLALAAGGCDRGSAAEPLGVVPPFALVDRSGRAVTLETLKGRVWIADFVFTRCAGPCPRMTGSMARLAREIDSKDVRFVSITVDPENDTPSVLDAFARSYGADAEPRWLFLTGDAAAIRSLCHDGFRLSFAPAPPGEAAPGAEVAHSTRFVVVDRDARIVGYFDGEEEDSTRRIAGAVARSLE